MTARAFLEASARERTVEAIRSIESSSSAEVVVAVKRRAAHHVATSLGLGLGCALLAFVALYLSPRPYGLSVMLLESAGAFGLAAGLAAALPALRRRLTPRSWLRAAAVSGADRAFAELGIEKTRQACGILVYVALFEREVVVRCDRGIAEALLGERFAAAKLELARAVRELDFEAFRAALLAFAAPLTEALPRRPGDENELCDQVA